MDIFLSIVVAAVALFLIWRVWRQRSQPPVVTFEPYASTPATPTPEHPAEDDARSPRPGDPAGPP